MARSIITAALVTVTAAMAGAGNDAAVAPTAGDRVDVGVLRFAITDPAGRPIPGRLTFVTADGAWPTLFVNAEAAPDDLAVRRNVIYTLSGAGRITVPAGHYTVHASHGPEWSLDTVRLEIAPQQEATWTARLTHEVETTGWISGDFHLHTLTHSGHGDSSMPERVISLVGEGVEFAVATDHNHNTDYVPVLERLGATAEMTAVTGNEVSTPIGHFNAFPLDPAAPPVEHRLRDAAALFALMREQTNPFGVVPVIQVNHPRWRGIDYFGAADLDPVTSIAGSSRFSDAFDSIEILNHNAAWGYNDAEMIPADQRGPSMHWAMRDWFNLLDQGHRFTAVGNSDSHHVIKVVAGYPRNFLMSATDDPGAVDPRAVADAVRRRRLFTTTGPFVELEVDGEPMGGSVTARGSTVDVSVRVQAASWIDCDRAKILVNGDVVETLVIAGERRPLRLETTVPLAVEEDCWVALIVEGDDVMAPIVAGEARPTRPVAITNPIWVDADGDGSWTAPAAAAAARVTGAADAGELLAELRRGRPAARGLLLAAAAGDGALGPPLIAEGLRDDERSVRLAAARAAERSGDASLAEPVAALLADETTDPYLATAALRAMHAVDRDAVSGQVARAVDRYGVETLTRYEDELIPILPGRFVSAWMTLGYFPGESSETLVSCAYGPETNADTGQRYAVKQAADTGWRAATTRRDGFLNLGSMDPRPSMHERAIAYAQTWIHAPTSRGIHYALGTDDGCQLFVNDRLVYQHAGARPATPLGHVDEVRLDEGWNRVLVKVANERRQFGLYFRVLDDTVTFAAERP